MSIKIDKFCSLFPSRIKAERERLGFSQAKMAKFCGVSREMWGKYEGGKSFPNSKVLFQFMASGADIMFLMKGEIKNQVADHRPLYGLQKYQIDLLNNLAKCSDDDRDAIQKLVNKLAQAETLLKKPGVDEK